MRSAATVTKACVVCGGKERVRVLDVREWTVIRCVECGLHTLDPEPTPEQLIEVFDDGTIYEGAFGLRDEILAQHAKTLTALERRVRPGRLLDVGCGLGYLLEAARERGWDATGIDPSPFSVDHVRGLGFEAQRGLLHDVDLPEASFDAVAILQVIEHVIDPSELLEGCKRFLKPGGALLVATPNPTSHLARARKEEFNYWIPPVHCVWYPPATLGRVLRGAGFERPRVRTWSARTRKQHDGLSTLVSTRVGRAIPSRFHWKVAQALAVASDALRAGPIVEATALRPEVSA